MTSSSIIPSLKAAAYFPALLPTQTTLKKLEDQFLTYIEWTTPVVTFIKFVNFSCH